MKRAASMEDIREEAERYGRRAVSTGSLPPPPPPPPRFPDTDWVARHPSDVPWTVPQLTWNTAFKASPNAQRAVLRILHDEYSVYTARVVEMVRIKGGYKWYFRGCCPHHQREHTQNRWGITQFDNNQDFCLFHCFHGDVKKKIVFLPLDWYVPSPSLHLADLL